MNQAQKRQVFTFLGILAALAAAVVLVLALKYRTQRPAGEEAPSRADPGIIASQPAYTALTYDNGSTTLSFSMDETGKWVWDDDPEFPLDASTVTAIVNLLGALKPQQTLTEPEPLDAYGLDQPFASLTATGRDGETLTIGLGNATTDGDSYYMLMNGQESPVYIIADTLYLHMTTAIYEMCLLPELPLLTEEAIQSVSLEGAASTLLRALPGEEEPVTWVAEGREIIGSQTVTDLLSELAGLTVSKCVDFKPTEEAAAICGFEAPTAEVSILYLGQTGTEESLSLTIGAQTLDETGYYVRLGEDTTIYQMDLPLVDTLVSVAETGLGT